MQAIHQSSRSWILQEGEAMESTEENLRSMDSQVRLYCGKCDTECDYMGVNPTKILAFVCTNCNEFNDVDDETEDDRWLYATNNYATISADVIDGRVRRLSPIAQKHVSKTVEQFAKDFGAKRLFVFRKDELTKSEITMVCSPAEIVEIHPAVMEPVDIKGQPVYTPPKEWVSKYKRRRRNKS
jgi:hypothetical protein